MLSVKDLHFAYKSRPLFSGLSLDLHENRLYGLLGENGVGKTTLLKLICGLLRAGQGTVTIDDHPGGTRRPSALSRLFFLPDTPSFPKQLTPHQYLKDLAPFYPNVSPTLFDEMSATLQVATDTPLQSLSFGQQKKALIAAALALRTDYLFLDEPTNGLDIPSKRQLRSILDSHKHNSTIVISTHQVADVESVLDHVVILSNGSILLDASCDEISHRLLFHLTAAPDPTAIFCDRRPEGYLNVSPNPTQEPSPMNMEALFNAVVLHPDVVRSIFRQ